MHYSREFLKCICTPSLHTDCTWLYSLFDSFVHLVQDCLQRLAKASISKMPAKRCKKKKCYSIREKEGCAVCLEDFYHGQVGYYTKLNVHEGSSYIVKVIL